LGYLVEKRKCKAGGETDMDRWKFWSEAR